MRGESRPGGCAGGLVEDRSRIEQRVVLGQNGSLERITAGVSQLEPDEQVVAECRWPRRGLLWSRSSSRPEGEGIGRIDDELARIGPTFRDDGARLAPDELGAAGAETSKPAECQFAGRAVELGVAPFHRLDRQPVAHQAAADRDRPEERR